VAEALAAASLLVTEIQAEVVVAMVEIPAPVFLEQLDTEFLDRDFAVDCLTQSETGKVVAAVALELQVKTVEAMNGQAMAAPEPQVISQEP
jgi:hypothetical protein